MVKAVDKVIDGHEIKVVQFTAREGLSIFTKLGKLIGPALADISQISDLTNVKEAELANRIFPALSKLLAGLSEEEFTPFILRLLRSTTIDRKEITAPIFDLEFAGNYGLLMHVVAMVLQVNYADFFGPGGIGGLVPSRQESANQPTEQRD